MSQEMPSADERRAETARLLNVDPSELDYIGEPSEEELDAKPAEEGPSDDELDEAEAGAAEARSLVVPNRISYGVYLQVAGFDGTQNLYKWLGLADTCTRTTWYYLWASSINRWERAGYCRRPQTDAYDIRWKIYWRA